MQMFILTGDQAQAVSILTEHKMLLLWKLR